MAFSRRASVTSRYRMARALQRIHDAGSDRARHLCELIVQEIALNPSTPYDPTPDDLQHLRDSYYVDEAGDGSGDWVIKSGVRYWRFVEFGTKEHGDAQPHIRPAVELVRRMFA